MFSLIAFYAKITNRPKFGQWMFFASATIKESHGDMRIREFPVIVLKVNTATVGTVTNQAVVSECAVERDGKHIREQFQTDAHFFLLVYFQ